MAVIAFGGHYGLLSGYDLSRDEQMATFDAAVFARGQLVAPLGGVWRAHAEALNMMFMYPTDEAAAWISAYLPLNAALRFLCKTERKPGWLILSFADGTLRLTLGRTRRDVAASGKWPHSARVDRTWAVTLSNRPYAPPVTALQFHSGKLHARDFAVMCALEPSSEAEGDILDVWRVLARYGVTTDTVKALLASERSAPLGDERLLRDVMTVWKQVARFGVNRSTCGLC